MTERKLVPKTIETDVLLASRRRCCLCVFLNHRDEVRKGQIAHLNRDPSDSRFENLVWLCFDHHDEYDGRTSQAKGLTPAEVSEYRDRLYKKYSAKFSEEIPEVGDSQAQCSPSSDYENLRKRFPNELGFTSEPWRYALWQVGNQPEFFAYKAGNKSDGVCLIERIDLPDGRIVVACIQTAGNPGNSITNCVEELCFQVCERFEIPASRLIWLEHYDQSDGQWSWVTFQNGPPNGPFENPKWVRMTPALWRQLKLKPKKKLIHEYLGYHSKLVKLFDWPSEAIL